MTPQLANPDRCPLCGGANDCASQQARRSGLPQPPCWCAAEPFAAQLLAAVPVKARGKACVCRACACKAAPPMQGAQP